MLILDDPTTPGLDVTVTDQGAGDIYPTVGVIMFSGAVEAFAVNVSTGVSKPILGSAGLPRIDLSSIDVTTGTGGSLRILLTDTGFTGLGPAVMAIGGVTAGRVTYAAWADESNVAFAMGNPLGILGPYSGFFQARRAPWDWLQA